MVFLSPGIQGTPNGSDNQPRFSLPPAAPAFTAPAFTIRPSLKTKVKLLTLPLTQESVQSPDAVPDTIAPSTSGNSMPLAIRFSRPINNLNGYGSVTLLSIGTRPTSAVNATELVNVELAAMV